MISLHLHKPNGLGSSGKITGYNHNYDAGGALKTPF